MPLLLSSLPFLRTLVRPSSFAGVGALPLPSTPLLMTKPLHHHLLRHRQQSLRRLSSSVQQSPVPIKSSRAKRRRLLLRWLVLGTLTAGVGFYVWSVAVPDRRESLDPWHYYTNLKIRIHTSMPLNAISRTIGALSGVHIPVFLREPVYGIYSRIYDCRMDEAEEESFSAYPTFAAFFNRALKDGIRPISHSLLVSPADGTVLHFGKVHKGRIEFVKDHDYEIHEFLGPINADTRSGNALFQFVIYLAPGDYHAFHSPTRWRALEKVHFPGSLFSVHPSVLNHIPKLFCLNERVVLSGQWHHGYFSLSAIAATNVGDIVITNEPVKNRKLHETEQFSIFDETMNFKPGDKVGEFRMGSTIVLIFEAPENLDFCIKAGDKLRYGQSLVLQPAL